MITFIDPYVFAMPDNFKEPDAVELFLVELVTWASHFLDKSALVLTSEGAVHRLLDLEKYPTFEKLKQLPRAGEEGVSLVDVSNVLASISMKRPYLEDEAGIKSIIVEDRYVLSPQTLIRRLDDLVGRALVDALFIIAVASKDGRKFDDLSFGTKRVGELIHDTGGENLAEADPPQSTTATSAPFKVEDIAIVYSGSVVMIETIDGDIVEVGSHFENEIPLLSESSDVEVAEWSDFCESPHDVIQHAFETLFIAEDRKRSPMRNVVVGPNFIGSILSRGLKSQPGILKRIAQLAALAACGRIEQIPGADLHYVRESISGNSDYVRRRDNAMLCRCTVTKRGAGFRLHYWRLDDRSIELDEVLLESEV